MKVRVYVCASCDRAMLPEAVLDKYPLLAVEYRALGRGGLCVGCEAL